MNLFEKLTNKPVTDYVITYMDSVLDKKKRFRTPLALREYLKNQKFTRSKIMVEDNTLYVIYTSLSKPGFSIKSSEYFDISKYEKDIKTQLELFNNKLKFYIAESTNEYIIFKLPLRVVSSKTLPQQIAKMQNKVNQVSEDDIINMKYQYHIQKIPATRLASNYKISYGRVLKLVGREY